MRVHKKARGEKNLEREEEARNTKNTKRKELVPARGIEPLRPSRSGDFKSPTSTRFRHAGTKIHYVATESSK